MRTRAWAVGFVALFLVAGAPVRAEDEPLDTEAPADTEAPLDEAVSKCVTRCETQHDACQAAAKAQADDCERQKRTCDAGCAQCRRMNGPRVVYCVQDCDRCRNRLAASPCAKPATGGDDCARTLDKCLERCGP